MLRAIVSRIQYSGSLYVDTYQKIAAAHLIKPVAPILVLNGNIGLSDSYQTKAFITHCSRCWDQVMYVPGPYEFSKESVSDVVARLHAVTSGLSNVQIMMNKEVIMNGHETIFLGTPYLDESDRDWLQRTYNLHHKSPYKIVALTVGSPSGLIHPVAWIHGSEPGFYSAISQNLVPVTCNTRGRMTNLNKTWLRDAFIEIPVNTKR